MADISAALVKELREETGLPLMDCKRSFAANRRQQRRSAANATRIGQESDGDATGSQHRRRPYRRVYKPQAGCRRHDRAPSRIGAGCQERRGDCLGERPRQATSDWSRAKTPEELWKQPAPSRKGVTLQDWKDELENKIREVFRLARTIRIDAPTGGYVHHDAKSGVLLVVEGGNDELARNISMHVAAMRPKATTTAELDKSLVDKERAILSEQARKEGKPENIIEKMIDGRMRNFYAEHVLSEQPFIRDDKQTVGKAAAAGGMKLVKFIRWQLGETAGEKPSN